MYTGYLAVGGAALDDERFEIINTGRLNAYVRNWNAKVRAGLVDVDGNTDDCISWVEDCDDCPGFEAIFSPDGEYFLPEYDPAPWYDPAVPDSARFLGIMGIEVTGVEDSTYTSRVEQALGGGGAIGRPRAAPRTMVVRVVAVAVDDCGMEAGLAWMRCRCHGDTGDPCMGKTMWFFDCCPDCDRSAEDLPPSGPCWTTTYANLRTKPSSCGAGVWWPTTYAQLLNGPPMPDPNWCRWIVSYYELLNGLPAYSCDLGACVLPYTRQFHSVVVTSGPTILRRRKMSVGEMAEIEFTVTAADPAEYTPSVPVAALNTAGMTGTPYTEPPASPEVPDPFDPPHPLKRPYIDHGQLPIPSTWTRHTVPFTIGHTTPLDRLLPSFTLAAADEVQNMRVSLLRNGTVEASMFVPKIPAGAGILIDGARRRMQTEVAGLLRYHNGVVRSGDGKAFHWPDDIPDGDYTLVIDLPQGSTPSVIAEVLTAATGCS